MKCAICHDALDPEHPDAIYGRNPATNQMAWMHGGCARFVFEDLDRDAQEHHLGLDEKESK